jgi:hypothetical protein
MPASTRRSPRFALLALRLRGVLALALLLFAGHPSTARAQVAELNPTISSDGMGQSGTALFWEEDRSDWANPALLGYEDRLRYTHGRIQLVPDLSNHIFFEFDRVALGGWGIGVSIAGKPIDGLGGSKVDYGLSEATNENGDVVGYFHAIEQVQQIGVGLSLVRLYDSVSNPGGAGRLSRVVDLSVGHAWKTMSANYPLTYYYGYDQSGAETQRDRGALLRVTPIGSARGDDVEGGPGPRLDAALGYSEHDYIGPGTGQRVAAVAARFAQFLRVRPGPLWDVLSPRVAVGATWEDMARPGVDPFAHEAATRTGQEIDLFGLVTLRHGYVNDARDWIRNDTWGFGVRLQYRGFVGARYDWAEVPQVRPLDQTVPRHAFTMFFDPYRLVRAARGGGEATAQR